MAKSIVPTPNARLLQERTRDLRMRQEILSLRAAGTAAVVTSIGPALFAVAWHFWPAKASPIVIPLIIGVFAGIFFLCFGLGVVVEKLRDGKAELFVLSDRTNDPTEAVPALDALVEAMRNPRTDARRLVASYENVVDRLQAMIPNEPLSLLVAYGYHPSRPERTREGSGRTYIVDYDGDKDADHWERAMKAIEHFRKLLLRKDPILMREVVKAIGDIVPPLRAVLRNRNVPTWRIERVPPATTTRVAAITNNPMTVATVTTGDTTANDPYGDDDAAPEPQTQTTEPDALTPVESRMNASATMTAMALRSLITSFRAANPSLFHGDDLQTAETMLDSHLPGLVAAFVAADDASVGEVRDAERAKFAKALVFIADAMSDIMQRHARNARDLLATESRFIETRHGAGDPALRP